MSELILPKTSNPTLDANLQVFFDRYPFERSRIEFVLSQPIENMPVVKIEIPAVPSKPPFRALIIAGMGSIVFLADLLNDKTVRQENFQVFVIENNIDFLRHIFQYFDLRAILAYPKVEWLFMQTEESIKPRLFAVLKREHVASMMKNVHILETSVPQSDDVSAFYRRIPDIYNETVFHVFHNFGRIDDSLDGVRATLMNRSAILNYPGITEIKNAFKGIPALIVGAGPSLDKELQNIKKHNNKFVVICADAALKPLINAGIRVDYTTSIERLNDYQKPFFEGLEPVSTELIAFPVIQPDQFKIFPGRSRIAYRNYSFFAYFEKNWPKGIIKCGGSTSHLAIRLADWLGCPRAYLVGIDSAYERKEGTDLYRSHCSGTGHANWGDFVSLKDFNEQRQHMPAIVGTSNAGTDVMTNLTYYQWIKEYTEELAEIGLRMTIINCSAQGLKISGIDYRNFNEVAEKFDEQSIVKPNEKPVIYNRIFKHKEIMQNLVAWKTCCEELIKESDLLLAQPEPDTNRIDALMFVYNCRICLDSLFVAFVVQCCAKEFFELENEWTYLDMNNASVELKEKITVTKKKIDLFRQVLVKLIGIFEETKGE